MIDNIFSSGMNAMPGIDMYRSWVYPDLYPEERQPVLKNWPAEDIEEFVGRY